MTNKFVTTSKYTLSITLIFIFNLSVFAQEPNDCQFAVTVCGNSDFSLDVNGNGTQELNNSNSCSGQENNSLWLEVNIATSGTLAFTLTPGSNSINEDYDFFIFGPNVSCGAIGQAIRCSTTNPAAANQGNNLTGLNNTDPATNEGPGADGDSFVSDIDVLAGESYFIVIDRPIGNSPFSINWTGTATFPEGPTNPLLSNSNSLLLPNITICDDAAPYNDTIREIDFSQLSQDIINGESDVLVSYHLSESDANINIGALGDVFTNTTGSQQIFVRIENSTTGCFIINRFTLNVTILTNFNQPTDFEICDDDTDGDDQNGLSTFNFNTKSQEIINGITGINYDISYYLTQANAESETAPLPLNFNNTISGSTEIFVRIEDLDQGCVTFTSFLATVLSKPTANNVSLIQCDEDGIPEGFTTFNLTEAIDDITNQESNSSVEFYLSQIDAQNQNNAIDGTSFDNFFNPQIVYARVTNTNTGCVNFGEISLEVSTTNSNNASIALCDTDGTEDGFMTFDLSTINNDIIANTTTTNLDITFYETYNDALIEDNPLNPIYTNTMAYDQIIYARVENSNACYGISDIQLSVFELPNIEITDNTIYCENLAPATTTLTGGVINDIPNNYSYLWSTGETTTTIEVNTPGNYTVRVTNSNGCYKDRTITVLPSTIATITQIDVLDAVQNNSITISVTGNGGNYEYALNNSDGPYQDANTFVNVPSGLHTVYVRDKNNCGIAEQAVSVIGFPKFFTPNNDSENDFWQVSGISSQFQPNTYIYIFDRYGKLLKRLDPLSAGWDGTFNGTKMPSSDYWFKVKLEDGRNLTGHFSLKR
ncbi:T9SS type B sorting domain-containing protein [Winogradskyella eckloniae]|uniref:T9SS type B sorting domain-containing protein n=1 Tax=Winogradskyella eckloniae TaxID=1089306 RepID=UPI001563F454|nr:T9SS type B sorting domain-containing protein [Winogradskyella eckloniae]NRD19631.1 T9SS type B sorting domain-containing protein [Winogradskyella eckloniae]